jgi:hypothetical protein
LKEKSNYHGNFLPTKGRTREETKEKTRKEMTNEVKKRKKKKNEQSTDLLEQKKQMTIKNVRFAPNQGIQIGTAQKSHTKQFQKGGT